MDKISVCVIAYNEEKMIEKCINSILNQKSVLIDEILVGVNSSTDNTINILKNISKKDSRIKIINSEKGKPHAWNALNRNAVNNIRVFIDGDCWIESNAIFQLYNDLNKEIIIGGTLRYEIKNVSIVSKIIHFPKTLYSNYNEVCGAFYLVNYKKLKDRMKEKGFIDMPNNIISEDRWLVLIAEDINISRDSIVTTNACSVHDQILRNKRFIVGSKQIEKQYKNLNNKEFKYTRLKNKYKQFIRMNTIDKIIFILIFPIKKSINRYIFQKANKRVAEESNIEFIWDKIESSRK